MKSRREMAANIMGMRRVLKGNKSADRLPKQRKKNGEVVGPAGGETGMPRCLAED